MRLFGSAAMVAVCMALAACGSSSKPATASKGAGRRAQLAACMKKQGFNLPQRPRGNRRGRAGPPRGGEFGLGLGRGPNAGSSKFRAALRKCGATFLGRRRGFAANPALRKALPKFVACMRKNGYNLPQPNLSGNRPVFDPSKVNRSDPKFQSAARKCQSLLARRAPAGS